MSGKMAGNPVVFFNFTKLRNVSFTDFYTDWTARMEIASWKQSNWARRLTFKNDSIPCGFHLWIWDWNSRE